MRWCDAVQLEHKCGVFGIMHHPESLYLTYLGVFGLQHRGQEGAGIFGYPKPVTFPPFQQTGVGLVGDVFCKHELNKHRLDYAMGHVRYSTSGIKERGLAQPFVQRDSRGNYFAICHNGTIPMPGGVLSEMGFINDSSWLLSKVVSEYDAAEPLESFSRVLSTISGAFCLLVMTPEGMLFARDPWGFRPLVLGNLEGSPVLSSETCSLDLIGAKFEREVAPGEVGFIPFEEKMVSSHVMLKKDSSENLHQCVFELIYFSRPDSHVFGHSVYEARKQLGCLLARDMQVEADLVIPVPDSGVPASRGFSQESGLPWDIGIIRNHYVHRTFIEPIEGFRDFGVKIKHNPISHVISGKRLVVVDDSLVRSTTSRKIIALLRQHGAKEVHLAISSPPMSWPCFYGIDTPTREELIAARHSVDDIRKAINADSLGYLSVSTLKRHFGDAFCYACFDGRYQVARKTIEKSFESGFQMLLS